MVNQYEAVFILTPVLSEAQMKEAVDKFKDYLTNQGAEMVHEENWGLRKLAYPIQHKTTGFYNMVEFRAEGHVIEKLEIEFKRDERVLRFLTQKMGKYAVKYAEKKRRQRKEKAAAGTDNKEKTEETQENNENKE